MRAVIQRVSSAQVSVEGSCIGKIDRGIVALVGFVSSDDEKTMDYMLDKIINLRIFEDVNGKMNLSLLDVEGGLFIIPNFTLYADARKGRRPSYAFAASPDEARDIFAKFVEKAKALSITVQTGIFQADMKVSMINDGPVTILLDSERQF